MKYKNPFSLEDKTILITGASSGIGKAIAIECAGMGAKVIATGRNKDNLEKTVSLLNENSSFVVADINNDVDLNSLVDSLPKLDGLVLCAGINELWPVNFASKEKFEKIFSTNFFSPIELLRIIVKKKLFNHSFSVVAIDSIAGNEDFVVGNAIYGAGKAALKSFMKYCSLEWASKNIRVNTISPGLISTGMHPKDILESNIIEKIPMKRWGQPEDIAPAAVYLLSNASLYVTGSDIKIDGGYTI